jgi:hypothetical protein
MPGDGRLICPLVGGTGHRLVSAGLYSFPVEGLGEADRVAAGLADVGVVQQPVDGGGGQGLGHQLIEPGRVEVRRQRDRAFLIGGIHDAVEPFGGVMGYR